LDAKAADFFAKEAIMKCEICDQEVENAAELLNHMERLHPPAEGDENLEKPDLLGATPEESAAREIPKPLH
jgi:hypothetical protein